MIIMVKVRWYLNIGYSKGMTMLQNGNILLSDASNGPDSTSYWWCC